jgi:hypothetical protein
MKRFICTSHTAGGALLLCRATNLPKAMYSGLPDANHDSGLAKHTPVKPGEKAVPGQVFSPAPCSTILPYADPRLIFFVVVISMGSSKRIVRLIL